MYSASVTRVTATAVSHGVTGTGERDLRDLLVALRRATSYDAPLGVDLSPLDEGNPSSRRVNSFWISCLTNLLVGRFSDLPLKVALPTARGVRLQLLRGGFYYALAQRPGPVEYTASDDASEAALSSSTSTWAPNRGPVLFEEASGRLVGGRSYLYANTHSRAEPGYFRRYQGSAAFPFLGHVIPRPRGNSSNEVREAFLMSACKTVAEVLDNFSAHAFKLRDASFDAAWLGPMIVDRAKSCLLVSLTAGGTNSHDRLHFVALDNGFGIPRTMRWQHPAPLRLTDSANIMERVLRERLTDREIDGHAGAGLWRLCTLARFAGGTIAVTSEDDRSDGQSATRTQISVPPAAAEDWSLRTANRHASVPWRGTTVHVQIRIPRSKDVDERQLRRLTHKLYRHRAAKPQPV